MFWKKLFTLVAWYVAWNMVSSYFSKNKWDKLKKELKKAEKSKEETFKVLLDHFVETHKNLLKTVKSEIMTEKNIKLFNEKKADLYKVAEDYKNDWEKILADLKGKWWDAVNIAKNKLEELYNEKKDIIDSLKEEAPDKITELKKKLWEYFSDLKNKIKK